MIKPDQHPVPSDRGIDPFLWLRDTMEVFYLPSTTENVELR
jgi:hypothetical protein